MRLLFLSLFALVAVSALPTETQNEARGSVWYMDCGDGPGNCGAYCNTNGQMIGNKARCGGCVCAQT